MCSFYCTCITSRSRFPLSQCKMLIAHLFITVFKKISMIIFFSANAYYSLEDFFFPLQMLIIHVFIRDMVAYPNVCVFTLKKTYIISEKS